MKSIGKLGIIVFLLMHISATTLVFAANDFGDRPTIVIGDDINYPPYSFIDEEGKPAGQAEASRPGIVFPDLLLGIENDLGSQQS